MAAPPCPLIDTHIHLDHEPLRSGLNQILDEARSTGVCAFVLPGVRAVGWPGIMDLCTGHPGLFAAPGLHPLDAENWNPQVRSVLAELLSHPRTVALGEVGLDFFPGMPDAEIQRRALREQIALAREAAKPLLIHCRRGWGELIPILRSEGASQVGGILHGFSAGIDVARSAIDLGFAIGVGAALTWPGARKVPRMLRELPPEALVIETDAPDQSPHPFRGQQGSPCHLPRILQALADLRGMNLMDAAALTTENARRVLQLPEMNLL